MLAERVTEHWPSESSPEISRAFSYFILWCWVCNICGLLFSRNVLILVDYNYIS